MFSQLNDRSNYDNHMDCIQQRHQLICVDYEQVTVLVDRKGNVSFIIP